MLPASLYTEQTLGTSKSWLYVRDGNSWAQSSQVRVRSHSHGAALHKDKATLSFILEKGGHRASFRSRLPGVNDKCE